MGDEQSVLLTHFCRIIFCNMNEPSDRCKLLDIHDVLLIFLTEFQGDMLAKHGHKGICMDATYNVNAYDFHLITLIVLDDYQEVCNSCSMGNF